MFVPLTILALMATSTDLTPGDHTRTIDVDRRTRTYLVHIPPKYDPKKPTPVVLVFHGGASNAEMLVRFCRSP
jgi:poly(3-hydroxybutyrate) depolymerase